VLPSDNALAAPLDLVLPIRPGRRPVGKVGLASINPAAQAIRLLTVNIGTDVKLGQGFSRLRTVKLHRENKGLNAGECADTQHMPPTVSLALSPTIKGWESRAHSAKHASGARRMVWSSRIDPAGSAEETGSRDPTLAGPRKFF
jgi:hypothetical protein